MIEKVRQWLETQGFPLEMKVAAAFRQAGFEVRQSSHYVDPQTGKAREIDVLATDPDFMGIIGIHFAIECKSSKRPWVLLASQDALSGYNRMFALGVLSQQTAHAFNQRIIEGVVDSLPWFRKDDFMGYSFRLAFAEGSDLAYAAAISAAKACEHLVRPLEKQHQHVAQFTLAFPVIVVDAPLIQCWLTSDGQLQLEEVPHGEFLFSARLPHFFGSCIRVVTLNHLLEFAHEAKAAAQQFRAALKSEEQKVVESWKLKGKRQAGSHET